MATSPIFAFGGNNAPQPLPTPGNVGNPPSTSGGTPQSNLFGITTPSANAPVFGGTSLSGMSSGFPFTAGYGPGSGDQFYKSLSNAFGSGTAGLLWNILQGGLFNPSVASAFLNAMQPAYNQGVAGIENAFGAEGSRFGSAAALGLGNYASQFGLEEQQTLANMFLTSQQEQLGLLQSILPTLHAEKASGGGILGDILGGLEVAGGAIAAPFTGGATIPLIGAGIGTIAGSNMQGGGGSSLGALTNLGLSAGTQTYGNLQNNLGYTPDYSAESWFPDVQSISAGADLGGSPLDPASLAPYIYGDVPDNANLVPWITGQAPQ